jgi:hypothetical protein
VKRRSSQVGQDAGCGRWRRRGGGSPVAAAASLPVPIPLEFACAHAPLLALPLTAGGVNPEEPLPEPPNVFATVGAMGAGGDPPGLHRPRRCCWRLLSRSFCMHACRYCCWQPQQSAGAACWPGSAAPLDPTSIKPHCPTASAPFPPLPQSLQRLVPCSLRLWACGASSRWRFTWHLKPGGQ